MPDLVLAFGIGAAVLMGAGLISGVVDRSPFSFPLIYLALGVLLSERGFELLELEPDDAILEAVATLTLALVLFLDAVKLQVDELGRRWLAVLPRNVVHRREAGTAPPTPPCGRR